MHGQINQENQTQNLVLGINDINKEIKAGKMYNFTKYYQKIIKNSNNKFIDVPKEVKSTYNETIFYIIGHSLDESDKEYIIDLFNFLKFDNDKYSKVCVFYHGKNDYESKLKNLFSIEDKNNIVEMNREGRLFFVELSIESIIREFRRETYFAVDPFDILF